MADTIDLGGIKVTARDLMRGARPSSWPDIHTTDVNGVLVRWQYANADGPCPKQSADRIVLPFAHGRIPKGTALAIHE